MCAPHVLMLGLLHRCCRKSWARSPTSCAMAGEHGLQIRARARMCASEVDTSTVPLTRRTIPAAMLMQKILGIDFTMFGCGRNLSA